MQKQAKRIFWNAMLLTAATLLVRTVGVWFQVYISNRAGAEAMGLFSLMGGVYGFALTLATSGIHLGVTHVVVDAMGRHEPWRIAPAMRRAVLYAILFGVTSSFLLIRFAPLIGSAWIKDVRTVSSLRLFGITLPLISISSALGGYFTAVRRAYKNATVQVAEQAVKIGATMYLLAATQSGDVEKTCCALVLGGVVAELLSFLLSLLLYLIDRAGHFPHQNQQRGRGDGKRLIKIALPVALTAYVRSGLVTLEHILIPEGLRNSGSSHGAALIAYGSIQGMALPIILYPAALISSFSSLLIPELAEGRVQNSSRRINYMISRVWWLSLAFSIGVAGILICFSAEIGDALYPNTDAGRYIRMLAPLIPIMYVDTATDAMMKGLGEQVFSMNVNVIDALISVVLVWILIPRYGILGYLVTIYFSELFNTVLSIHHLLKVSNPPVRLWKWVYKPLLSIVGATALTRILLQLTNLTLPHPTLSITVHCVAVTVLYIGLLILTGCVEKEDAEWLKTLFVRKEKTAPPCHPRHGRS
ncbi:MAG: polysaccharide biosynthesis C-terminal domain-containing protein [Clostridia bacterium]|nr:polysaccharide biosynthesis C-terminal domain-containing protein [Clostridia bacterium]